MHFSLLIRAQCKKRKTILRFSHQNRETDGLHFAFAAFQVCCPSLLLRRATIFRRLQWSIRPNSSSTKLTQLNNLSLLVFATNTKSTIFDTLYRDQVSLFSIYYWSFIYPILFFIISLTNIKMLCLLCF